MRILRQVVLIIWCGIGASALHAQLPFYTDDSEVTDSGTLHFESFDEYDGLQSSQYPNLRQNTTNFKVNMGMPHNLELDFDFPYLGIFRTATSENSEGLGDMDMGLKWKARKAGGPWRGPALATSLYIEFPTGNVKEQLGSGLRDYWLNTIAQEEFSDKTRMNVNFGFLFAGNTSTGVVGVQTLHGHVYTGGLSLVHDVNARLSLGGEVYGGVADVKGLGRDQLQAMLGAQYALTKLLTVTLAVLGGKYEASPPIGGQVGIAVDFPGFVKRWTHAQEP
jgi:hypothetical protein